MYVHVYDSTTMEFLTHLTHMYDYEAALLPRETQ